MIGQWELQQQIKYWKHAVQCERSDEFVMVPSITPYAVSNAYLRWDDDEEPVNVRRGQFRRLTNKHIAKLEEDLILWPAKNALESSIEHWEENAAATSPHEANIGSDKCGLCRLYLKDDCKDCPVAKKTGRLGCHGSPYHEAKEIRDVWLHYPNEVWTNRWQAAARKEVEFLKGLRDED
jgi:hypothetical protein